MKAAKIMKLRVVTAPPDVSVAQAHASMLQLGIRHLPVVSDHKLVGILSDRDVLLAVGKSDAGAFMYPRKTVGELMSLSPRVAAPGVSVSQLARLMVEEKIDAVPVVSGDNTLLGLVTSSDLMLLLTEMPEEATPTLSYEVRRVETLPASA